MIHLNKTGNWYILADEPYIEVGIRKAQSIGEVSELDLTQDFLDYHAEQCLLYKIPMYVGRNDLLHQRCDDTLTRIKEQLCQNMLKLT